jgi:hypothetical protein
LLQNTQDEDSDSSDSEFDYETLFAPDDYEPYLLQRKSDRFGLGYSGLSRHSVLGQLTGQYGEGSSKSHLVMKEKGKKVISSLVIVDIRFVIARNLRIEWSDWRDIPRRLLA